jgi:hypothetical protein
MSLKQNAERWIRAIYWDVGKDRKPKWEISNGTLQVVFRKNYHTVNTWLSVRQDCQRIKKYLAKK